MPAIPIAETTHATASLFVETRGICLEDMLKPHERNETLAAERQIEARDERAVAVDPESDAIGDVEVAEVEIATIGGNLAGIDEQCPVEQPRRFPAVLRGQRQAVVVPEAELTEPAQRLAATERRLVVEGHLLPAVRVGEHRHSPQRE